jgi:hypothetical protein
LVSRANEGAVGGEHYALDVLAVEVNTVCAHITGAIVGADEVTLDQSACPCVDSSSGGGEDDSENEFHGVLLIMLGNCLLGLCGLAVESVLHFFE